MKRAHALVIALALTGCGSQPATHSATPSPGPSVSPLPDAKARLAAAVRAAFPKGVSIASDDPEAPRRFDENRLIDAPFGPVLVSNGSIEMGQERLQGVIAVSYLKEAAGSFTVAHAWPEAVKLGSMGHLTEWAVSGKFLDVPLVYALGGQQAEGYRCDYTVLTALTPNGPVKVASFQTTYDDKGAVESGAQEIEGKIGDIVRGRGFTVHYAGTSRFDEYYVWRGGKFVRQGGPSKLPAC